MKYSKETLKDILNKNGYSSANELLITSVINQIEDLSEEANAAFSKWINNQEQISFEINGVSSDFLRQTKKYNEIALLLSYDHLLKESKEGKSDFSERLKERKK